MVDSKVASEGGKARARKLSKERKHEIAQKAAEARWGKEPRATHTGAIKIGDREIACAVLADGRRVITQKAFFEAFDRTSRGPLAKDRRAAEEAEESGQEGVLVPPPFLDAENLRPFISAEMAKRCAPIPFKTPRGHSALGYEASLLPDVCEVYLAAKDADVLTGKQPGVAQAAYMLMRALAKVGIEALVDEATGYQYDRARDYLSRLLEKYIAEELRPWTPLFPHDFFRLASKLCGWEYKDGVPIRPQALGDVIDRVIYQRLPAEVREELLARNPRQENGRRKYVHTQLLTEETGVTHLDKVITVATAMMRAFDSKEEFYRAYDKAVPIPPRLFPEPGDGE